MDDRMIVRFPMDEHPDNIGICGCGCGQEIDADKQAFVIDAIDGNEVTVTVWRLVLQPQIHRSGTSSQWLELDSAL